MKYTFSGHESFQCKSLWLKKGYDFVSEGRSFNDEYALVALGVGKNMVSSIRFWLKAFGITNPEGEITEIGKYLLSDDGKDPFMEDPSTLWLLHYLLVSTKYATIYNTFFCNFIRNRHDFTKDQFQAYLKKLFTDKAFGSNQYNENTIGRDISTLLKNYVRPKVTKNFDDFSAVLADLNLISQNKDTYSINHTGKAKVNPLIFLFALLDSCVSSKEQKVIEYPKILEIATIFTLNQNELYEIFDLLNGFDPGINFSNTAGEQLFTIDTPIDKWKVLDSYYAVNL